MDAVWGNRVVTGEVKAEKPGLLAFNNIDKAINMLHKHILKSGNIVIHCDVDVDGIGSGYIIGKFLATQTNAHTRFVINRDKVHGIQQKHVDFFKNKPLDLLIIVDSSSNELDIIKQFNCDVLVIDHHEVGHSELSGLTNDGKHNFVIVNNTLDNSDTDSIRYFTNEYNIDATKLPMPYVADDRMSCGLVIYELLRVYSEAFKLGLLLENMMLYQWAGVTLFTDAITLNTPRNQWYIENTVHSNDTEVTLKRMLSVLNPFKTSLDKTTIGYTIAPVINKAIRAGHSGDALNSVLFNPEAIDDLKKYADDQAIAVETGIKDVVIYDSYITRDLSNTEIHKNYNGVIASRLCGEYNRNAVVYGVFNGIAEGSFRGRMNGIDYRKFIDEFDETTWAQGHKSAFGFRCPIDKLDTVMGQLTTIEHTKSDKYLLTAGKINADNPGDFVIESMDEFKKQGGIWRLGVGNSKVNNDEQIFITVSSSDAVLTEQRGKLYLYNVLGLQCKAFEIINKPVINIYVEFSRQIDCYIK